MYCLVLVSLSILACKGVSYSIGNDWSCFVGGRLLTPGQRVDLDSFTWECQMGDGRMARTAIVACLDDEKKEHPIGDRWDTGNAPFRFVFECFNDGWVTSRRVAQCFYDSPEGQVRLDANQEKQVGKNLVKCESDGNGGLKYNIIWGKSVGSQASPNNNAIKSSSTNNHQESTCNVGGKELKVGSRSQLGSFVYECHETGTVDIVACVDDNKSHMEHPPGDQWVEGSPPFRYVFQCAKNGGGVIKKAVKCAYVATDGHETKIEFGKEETVEDLVVQCLQVGVNGAQYVYKFTPAYMAFLNANGGSSKSQK